MELAAPEMAEVLCGRENFKRAAKRVGRQTSRNQLGCGSKHRKDIPKNSIKQVSLSRRLSCTNFSRLSCQTICGTNLLWHFLRNFGRKVKMVEDDLLSYEQKVYPTTALDEI